MRIARLTESAELRLLQRHHAEAMFALTDANREHLRPWLPWVDETNEVDDTLTFIEESLYKLAETGAVQAGIWVDGEVAGAIGCASFSTVDHTAEIGYWLGEEYEGRGLMTRAVRALTTYLFDELDLHRVIIRAATDNVRSRAIPERLGFRHEATLREAGYTVDGFVDLELYAMLTHEWNA